MMKNILSLTLWFKVPEKLRFLLTGGVCAGISYLMFAGFVLWLGTAHYQLSLALAWGFSSIVSFFLQKILVFRSRGRWLPEYLKCLITWFVGWGINAGALAAAVSLLRMNLWPAQAAAIALTAAASYLLFKYFVFKKKDG